jgi:ribosomal protein S18 acetylase RimI-like enzyme
MPPPSGERINDQAGRGAARPNEDAMTPEDFDASAERADALVVQKFVRSRVGDGARTGPFSILFSPGDRSPYGNYAIPDDDARPTSDDVTALEEAFRTRKRRPRLEYVPAACPAVEAVLVDAGFTVELRPPLMTRRPVAGVAATIADGFDLVFVDDPVGLEHAVSIEAEANDGDEADFQFLKRIPGRGGRVAVAYERRTGEPASAGAFIRPIDGVTEVVSIATRPAFRRIGLGQAITAMLAEGAFAAGCHLTWLSAAGEAQSKIYARAGFMRREPMLFISKQE